MDPREEDPAQPLVHNHIADQHGYAVQAGIVHGGVHLHPGAPAPRRSRSRLVWVISGVVVLVAGGLIGTFAALNQPKDAGPQAGPPADPGPAVSVALQNQVEPGFQPAVFALAAPLSPAPTILQAGQQIADIVHDHDGVEASRLELSLVLTGHRAQPVTVTGLRAVIDRREPTLRGSALIMASEGSADAVDTCIALGSGDEIARVNDPSATIGTCATSNPSYFAGHFISLAKNESIVINCTVDVAADNYFEFGLRMTIVTNGVSQEIPINDDGKPLRVTAYAHHYLQAYETVDQATQLQQIDPSALNSGGDG